MAYVLSLPPQSPLKRSFSETPYLRSTSSSHDSLNTIRRCRPNNVSATSLITLTSVKAGSWARTNENAPPKSRTTSFLDLISELPPVCSVHNETEYFPEKPLRPHDIPLPPSPLPPTICFEVVDTPQTEEFPDISLPEALVPEVETESDSDSVEWPIVISYASNGSSSASSITTDQGENYDEDCDGDHDGDHDEGRGEDRDEDLEDSLDVESPEKIAPFRRWVSTLRRRNKQRSKELSSSSRRWTLDGSGDEPTKKRAHRDAKITAHKKSNSLTSSMGFVTAVKSASITLASTSIAPLTLISTMNSRSKGSNHGSTVSDAKFVAKMNSTGSTQLMDERASERAKHRRRTLEEIITSEEGYIGDMKVLVNVYLTVLASTPAVSSQTRLAIHRNVSQILQLHEDLLGELHRIVPNPEYVHDDSSFEVVSRPKHVRWQSVDIVPGRKTGIAVSRRQQRHSMDICQTPEPAPVGLTADTKTVADVAGIFDKFMKRFFAYEEYSSKFESVNQELESTYRTIPAWSAYERGVEALSCAVTSVNNKEASCKKGLTLADLLIKPIQRPAKYPLFFSDLLKHTPVADDPVAHAELEKVYYRLKDAIQEINNAKDDPVTRRLIETTWLLQDRLVFSTEQILPHALLTRLLGHVVLCGVLHVAYQTNERVEGKYMICILFRSCLLLAITDKGYATYHVVAAIALGNGSIEQPNNGRGLQCHTALFTWKLVFEAEHRLFEIILSACSAQEEDVWKKILRQRIAAEDSDLLEGRSTVQELFSSLTLNLKNIGPAFGQPDSFTRRMSIKRAGTVGPKTNLNQVIIKNTEAQKKPLTAQSTASLPVGRSQSHLSTCLVPTLAPRRAERVRLETAICDVWTRDALPYPGMSPRRAENPIRASANSVMRKLSMASITSNFSKRSGSYASLSQLRREDHPKPSKRPSPPLRKASLPSTLRRPVFDFHKTPTTFLPADFELKATNNRRRRQANRAMVFERATEHMVLPMVPAVAVTPSPPEPTPTTITPKRSATTLNGLSNVNGSGEVVAKPAKPEVTVTSVQEQEIRLAVLNKPSCKPRTRRFKFWARSNDAQKTILDQPKRMATPTS
ncbi:uncharacterized protein K452DRAFT_320046 [Aplosporella prunicola CBS 121167]|uniref:DH domain-containing protein n=1 Tax=Aplosporella prunicola CBS 121167 TaxID=1176127 RepID=A0A6A6B7S2_9PEZI|nr:uncharacterized protein K452DRAFT_320046 [Aplosporella prunicola CBS 121167]KAF2139956.1 hypothetical protein K452DRAFT_320046 [Aplosporella prunicola CBS 121167]